MNKEVKWGTRAGAESFSISAEIPSTPILEDLHAARARLTSSGVTVAKSKVGLLGYCDGEVQAVKISLAFKGGEAVQTEAKWEFRVADEKYLRGEDDF